MISTERNQIAATCDPVESPEASSANSIDDIEFLRRGLLLGDGFQLYLVGAESLDSRQRAVEELRSTPGLAVVSVTGGDLAEGSLATVIATAFAKQATSDGRPVVIVDAIDETVADDPRLLARLNEQRSEFVAGSTGAVVILATPRVIADARRLAPDTWSIRAADVDVTALVPRPTSSDTSPRLQPIRPPYSDERWVAQAILDKGSCGDESGRAALRLAEIFEFHGASDGSIGQLYRQAAENIQDQWLVVLARVNAGRALTRARDRTGATRALDQALKEATTLDHGLCAYALVSLVDHHLAFNALEPALEAADQAIQAAAQSRDADLLTEARISRAVVQRRLARLESGLQDAKAAEVEAVKVGNIPLAQKARVLLGSIATEAGLPRRAEGGWERYLQQHADGSRDDFLVLVTEIGKMEASSATSAAAQGWKVLRNLSERSGYQAALGAAVMLYLFNRIVWGVEEVDLSIWSRRLESLLSPREYDSHRSIVALLRVREALNRSDLECARSDAISAFAAAPSFERLGVLTTVFHLTRVAFLGMTGQMDDARSRFHELLAPGESRDSVFGYLATQVHNRSGDDLALADQVIVHLVLEWLGGIEAARHLGVLLTGGKAGELVGAFLHRLTFPARKEIDGLMNVYAQGATAAIVI